MKHFKKLTLAATAALLLLLAAADTSTTLLPLPSITVGEEETEKAPLPEESDIQPLVDEEDDEIGIKGTY